MAAKVAAFMFVMTLMMSTFTTQANGFNMVHLGRPLIRLRYLSYVDPRGLSTVEVAAAPAASSTTTGGAQAPASGPSANNKGQNSSWGSWFEQKITAVTSMFGGKGNSSDNGAPAPAPAA